MLLSVSKFTELSSRLHPKVSVNQWHTLFFLLEKNGMYATNKEIISITRSFFKTTDTPFSQVKCYEFFSKLAGEKDWNTANAKNIQFSQLFTSAVVEGKIRTMIPSLDRDLDGGLPRKGITSIVSGPNVGKTRMCISLASNFIRQGLKVMHVNLEGRTGDTLIQYSANLSDLEYRKIFEGSEKVNTKIMNKYLKNLNVIDWLDFHCMVEDVDTRLREIYQEFKFDVLVIDYAQLLSTNKKQEVISHRNTIKTIYETLNILSIDLNCAVISPAQATRTAFQIMKKDKWALLKSKDSPEFQVIGERSKIVLTLNKNEEEMKNEEVRLYLDKNELGAAKEKIYKIKTNFSKCNLLVKEIL